MNKLKLAGSVIAIAAAAAFTMAPVVVNAADAGQVKCMGSNACKGKSSCKSATSSCKGQNACKGKGMSMEKSKDDCTKKGGTVQE